MNAITEQKAGPTGDTAATSSWAKKLNAMDKSTFPHRSPDSKKPPRTKAEGGVDEGKTFKDEDSSDKKGKFEKIRVQREAKKKSKQDEEFITSLDLVESVIEKRPGNALSIFDALLKDRVTDLVAERRMALIDVLFNEQEEDHEVHRYDDDGGQSHEQDPDNDEYESEGDLEDEVHPEEDDETEELTELSAMAKKGLRIGAKADIRKKSEVFSRMSDKTKNSGKGKKFSARLLSRLKRVSEEEETDPANNTKVTIKGGRSGKSGNTEKKAHTQETLNRLRKLSPTKDEKNAIKPIG